MACLRARTLYVVGVLACFTCLRAWRALHARVVYELGVLKCLACLACLILIKCFLDVFDHGALVNYGSLVNYELSKLLSRIRAAELLSACVSICTESHKTCKA